MQTHATLLENDKALADTKKELDQAHQNTQEAIRRKILETMEIRKELSSEVTNMDKAIDGMEDMLFETERQREMQAVPLKDIDTSMHMRKQRVGGEQRRDTAAIGMEDHTILMGTTIRQLNDQAVHQRQMLKKMKQARHEMFQDLHFKLIAFKIDDMVAKLTQRSSVTKSSLITQRFENQRPKSAQPVGVKPQTPRREYLLRLRGDTEQSRTQ